MDYHSYGELIIHPRSSNQNKIKENTEKIIYPKSIDTKSKDIPNLKEIAKIAAEAMKKAGIKNRTYQIGTSQDFFDAPQVVGNQIQKIFTVKEFVKQSQYVIHTKIFDHSNRCGEKLGILRKWNPILLHY